MLFGKVYGFSSVKEVLAKANEEKSGDQLAGIAAADAQERVAAKIVLAGLTLAAALVLFGSFFAHQHLIDILFSGTQASVLPIRIEQGIREHIFAIVPERRDDAAFNIRLTYQVQGAYYAYSENQRRFGPDAVLAELDGITRSLYA